MIASHFPRIDLVYQTKSTRASTIGYTVSSSYQKSIRWNHFLRKGKIIETQNLINTWWLSLVSSGLLSIHNLLGTRLLTSPFLPNPFCLLCIPGSGSLRKKGTIDLVTAMLSTSENVLFPGYNHQSCLPLLLTLHFDYQNCWRSGDNQSVRSSALVVSGCMDIFRGG